MLKAPPPPPVVRHRLWEVHGEDVRTEWLGTKLRESGIPFDVEPVLRIDETFRPAGAGAHLAPPVKQATGRVVFFVPMADKDRANEVLNRLLSR